MTNNNKMSILVLSCDAYSDLWDDFFNLKDKYWPDCEYNWYVVNETKQYDRKEVKVINCGEEYNWSGRLRKAVESVNTPYIGVFLEDYFIYDTIDNSLIKNLVEFVDKNNVSFLNLSNVFRHILNLPNKEFYDDHMVIIPKHLKYGLDTSAAIWDKNYLLNKLGDGDYSAWQFEIDRCNEANSKEGFDGLILCDDRLPFNVSPIPVVIQGAFYPKAVKFFKKLGYEINTSNRLIMSLPNVLKFQIKTKASGAKYGRKFLKWIGANIFGFKFFTKN